MVYQVSAEPAQTAIERSKEMIPKYKHGRIPIGTEIGTGKEVSLSLQRLFTHVLAAGPPGCGKSSLLLWVFQCLCHVQDAMIVMISPKGGLCRKARDWGIAHGFKKRIVWLDADSQNPLVYNPTYQRDIPASSRAKGARELVRASSGQGSFRQTPQLARFLYLALGVTCDLDLTLKHSLTLLRSGPTGSQFRLECASRVHDSFLRDMLLWFESLSERRQDELASSTVARLEPFLCDPIMERMLIGSHPYTMADAKKNGDIVLVNLEIGKPLRIDDVKLLGRFIVNDVVNQAFVSGSQKRPIFLIIDEVQNFATQDLCSVLDMGRELGLCGIFAHQYLDQLKQEDQLLYNSMLSCARNKIIFGGLSGPDLEVLAKEMMIDQFDPYTIKDQITSLELNPIEARREVVSRGSSTSRSWSSGRSTAHTEGRGFSHVRSRQTGTSHGETRGTSHSIGAVNSLGESVGNSSGTSTSDRVMPDGSVIPAASVTSEGSTSGTFSGTSDTDTTTEMAAISDSVLKAAGQAQRRSKTRARVGLVQRARATPRAKASRGR